MLILGLTLFAFKQNNFVLNNTKLLAGDTDGVTSTKLSSLSVDGFPSAFTFSSNTLSYNINIYKTDIRLKIIYTALDKDAEVTVSGNEYITSDTGTVTINVHNGIEADTTYSINYSKTMQYYDTTNKIDEQNTAGSYSFKPTFDSYYLLEIWGAQGGTVQGYRGGYGGYSQGVVYLTTNDTIYIVTGGQGTGASYQGQSLSGGTNGGGGVNGSSGVNHMNASGGGATHVALNSDRGYLSNYNSYRGEVLMVAGGGGGGRNQANHQAAARWGYGGAGGGSSSSPAWSNFNTVSIAQRNYCIANQTTGYAFGQGETGAVNAGAGGGYMGGYSGNGICAQYLGVGSGGSGYIGNAKVISYGNYTKHMTAADISYNDTGESTRTYNATGVSATPTTDYAKTGNGAYRISSLAPKSNDYYLSTLTSDVSDTLTDFYPGTFNYTVTVPSTTSNITFSGTTHNSGATVTGLDNYYLDLGYNNIDITVTAANGDTGIYHLTVLREGLKGKHSSKLWRIDVNGQKIYTEENKYTYNLNLTLDSINAEVIAHPYDSNATYTVTGNNFILDNNVTISILVEESHVASTTYLVNLNITFENIRDNNYLKTLTVKNGLLELETLDPEFNTLIQEYTTTVSKYENYVDLGATAYDSTSTVGGTGRKNIKVGENNFVVSCTAVDGSVRNYNVKVIREGLNELTAELYRIDFDNDITYVQKNETEFDVEVGASTYSIPVKAYAFNENTKITYNGFGYIKSDKTAYIITELEGANPSRIVYTVNLIKSEGMTSIDFNYTGTIQTFTVPSDGYYQLEVWGAQGGSLSGLNGGFGAYSVGNIYLEKNTVLYIGVGGAGKNASSPGQSLSGGYNGGGSVIGNGGINHITASGGGATHIAINNNRGVLSKYANNRDEVLIVAGGGGGARNQANHVPAARWGHGGSGGGASSSGAYSNFNTTAVTQQNYCIATQTAGFLFGQGESTNGNSGGGGGYMGGYSGSSGSVEGYTGAGVCAQYLGVGSGGSGYIGHTSLQSIGDYTKHMTCYNCKTDSGVNTLTKTTTKYSSTATSDYAKSGNGVARITYLDLSGDNYLKTLKVTDISKSNDPKTIIDETANIEEEILIANEFNLSISSTVTQIRLEGKPNDSTATVTGTGLYYVYPGLNQFDVVVKAENDDTQTYSVKLTREADKNTKPDNIEINGLVQSLCNTGEKYCNLYDDELATNELSFNKEINEYYMTVPSRIKQVKYNVVKGHYFQVVTGDGLQDLTKSNTGTTDITIDVMSEYCSVNHLTDSSCYSHYTYHITRDTASDTDLKRLFVDNTNTTGEFTIDPASDSSEVIEFNYNNPDVYDYYFSVPNSWTNLKYLYYELDAQGQEVTIEGNETNVFSEAGKTYLVQVHVTAPNGRDTATYRLHVYRKLNSNIYLSNLEVKDVTDSTITYPLNMAFNKNAFDYEVILPFEISAVDLVYTTEAGTTTAAYQTSNGTKSGNRITNIPTGKTTITITTTSQTGDTGTYTIELTRTYNNDSKLLGIDVRTDETIWGIDSEDFDAETLEYTLNVDEGIDNVIITPALSDTITNKAEARLLDGNTIVVGENIKRILVTAEDGTYRTYTLTIIRPASTDAVLKQLTVSGSDSHVYGVALEEDTYEYDIEVPNDVNYVTAVGIKNSPLSMLYGNGKFYLQTGENIIQLLVQAEDGTSNTYTLNITRAYSSNATLKVISGSATITPTFDESDTEHTSYTINVDYKTNKMNLLYTPSVATTTVTAYDVNDNVLNGKRANNSYTLPLTLSTGDNIIKLVTLAEDNESSVTYTVNVNKAPCDDTGIKTLRLKETRLVKDANDIYKGKLPYNIDPAHLIVELNEPTSSYAVQVSSPLTFNDEDNTINGLYNDTTENITHTLILVVTSESGDTEEYTIDILVQAYGNASNYLTNISVDKGTMVPAFDKNTLYYDVEVDNNESEITVSGTLDDEDAHASGFGTYNLKVGENPLNVVVTATDGLERTYQVIVSRKPSDDATLKTLSINEASLNPGFISDIYEYTTSVDSTYVVFTNIVTTNPNATFEIINNEPGTLVNTGDEATVTIRVTAEDKKTTKDYKIKATKLPSGNNNLSDLKVVGYTLTPTFDKNVTVYRTSVENEVSTVLVEATSEDSNATITGTGSVGLATGVNNVSVNVTSESGVTKSYLLVITREYSNDATLEYLDVNNGTLSPEYDGRLTYDVAVDYSITKLDLTVMPKNPNATYEVIGNNITGTTGTVTIKVTAEDGVTQETYTLSVTKDISKNALLKDLSESNHEFTTDFNSYVFNYTMIVNYEVTELDLTAIPVNEEANVDILNYDNLSVGNNTVTVRVTSEDGSIIQDYKINVTRNKEVNNYLDYLFNDYGSGDFNETFNQIHHKYSLTVSSDTESITLYGEPKSSESTVQVIADDDLSDEDNTSQSYLGTYGLVKGTNKIKINVSNQGYTRTYYLTITREFNSDKELLSLTVKGNNKKLALTPEFEAGKDVAYSLTVDKDTNMIELIGEVSPLATVSGLGDVYLEPGLNVVQIVVTAEDGTTKITTINVTKESSTETHLTDIVPSSGELDPSFEYERLTYDLELDSSVLTLSFDVTLEDGNATVTGNESAIVPDGLSTRTIVVTAEDKHTTRTYTINVKKIISDDADLLNVQVKDYDFIDPTDESTKVTFDKDTQEYYVIVDNDKLKFNEFDLTVTKSNTKAKVDYSSEINLSTKEYIEFDVMVTAEDGITKKTYKINVKRKLGTSSEILKVEPTTGYMETSFSSDEYNYVWRVPVGRTLVYERLGVTLKDPNATVETSVSSENILTVVVTSEDGSSVSTYVFTGAYDYNTNVLIESLKVFDDKNEYPYTPEVLDDVFEYTVRVYEDQETVNVKLVPQAEEAKVLYNDLEVEDYATLELPNETNTFEFIILSEDGVTEQTYTIIIKKDILTEKNLSSLEVIDENEVCTSKTCIISPTFEPTSSVYKTSVPFEYEVMNIGVGLNEEQSVKFFKYENDELIEITNNEYELDLGTTTVYIMVYDLLGNQTKIYRLAITRNKSTNTKLDSLSISKDGTTYEFKDINDNALPYSNDVNEYYITVPYTVTEVDVNYVKNDDNQEVKKNGYNYFSEGETNDISVKVIAPDKKTTRTIIIHAYRESQYEVFLNDITVSSGTVWELSPTFDKRKTSYVVNVSNGTEYIKVEGFGDNETLVSAAETRVIATGINTFEITASKEFDGEFHTKVYTVTVIRPVASEVYLSNLKVSSEIDGEYLTYQNELGQDISFDRGTTDYYLEVSPGITNFDIVATPGRTEWKVNIYGNKFATGRNIVSIIVYNEEYTTSRTYQLIVTVKPSEDSSLTGIKVYDTYVEDGENKEHVYGVSQEDFEASEDNTYTVTVPYNVEKVILEATPTIENSVVVGEGNCYLGYGNNELLLYVEAEDGEHFTIYTVNVYREYDLYLSNLKVDDTQVTGFDKTVDNYTMEVENSVKSLVIEGIPEENNVEVIYSLDTGTAVGGEIINGKLYPGVGINKVLITVRAPDNTENTYHLDITKKQSDNNYLSALDFNEGNLNETFIKTDNNYTMYILDTYTSISYDNKKDILTEDPAASYTVDGLSNLSTEHDNTVTITVTSESGISNIYTVTVMLKPEEWFRHYLQKLELSYTIKNANNEDVKTLAVLSPQFVKEKMAYTVTVPYSVSSIIVDTQTYVPDDEALIKASTEATSLVANGTFTLDLGRNVINVKVYSTLPNNDGSYAIYKVIVYRQNNPDVYLASLAINDHILSPAFTPTHLEYSVDINTSETKLDIEAIPRDPGAIVEITGNGPFNEGSNLIKIVVTAADGTTKKEYKVTANCTLSDNNYLKSLDVKDYTIEPEFVKTNSGIYLVNVDNDVTNVFVTAVKEDPSATLSIQNGTNTYTKDSTSIVLSPGNNYIYVSVSSARGNTRTYTLNVFRSYSTDNSLKNLIISDGELDPEFDPEILEYDIVLDDDLYYLSTVSIIGFKNQNAASVRGNGEHTLLENGKTVIYIEVTAESGDKRTYKLNFIKKEMPSSQLLFLEVYEGELIPDFNKDGYKYYVTVPNEVTSLDLTIDKNVVAVDEAATITIKDNENFKVGINIVTIQVKSSNNDIKNYYLYVTRSILASNYLSDLSVEDQTIEPEFDSDTLYYSLTVGSNVDSVHVYAEKEDQTATLQINGSEVNDKVVSLNYGENKIYFTVTSENGASRTYTLAVTRSDSDEYYLLTLLTNLGTWDKTFDKDNNGLYTINVPEKTNMIVFSGTTSVGSTVEGLDSIPISLGDNEHKIIVTSPSGLKNTYNFNVIRPGSNNADILSITSNHGELTLDEGTYKLSVEDSASTISFTVNLSDKDAKVIMDSSYNLTYGKNEITIKVEAEDGTEKNVPIEIYRYKDIASITYDLDEIILNIGDEDTPTYTINPEDTDYKEVTFNSDDETIATVDSTGKITAVSEGVTYVYVSSKTKPSVNDMIKVNVASTKLKSDDYMIWRVGDSENNLASVNFSYVIGANDKTSIDDFFTHFDNNLEYLKVYSVGTLVTNQTTYVGTGMIIKLEIDNHVYDELTIIVRGDNGTVDKPGNGIITSTDYATLSSILAGLTVKTPIVSLLYDLNKNKILTVTDLSPMSLYIAGKATFTNLNGLE